MIFRTTLFTWVKMMLLKFLDFFSETEDIYCLQIPPETLEEAKIIARNNNVSVIRVFGTILKLGFIVDAIYEKGGRIIVEDEEGEWRTLMLFSELEEDSSSNVIDFKKIKRKKR